MWAVRPGGLLHTGQHGASQGVCPLLTLDVLQPRQHGASEGVCPHSGTRAPLAVGPPPNQEPIRVYGCMASPNPHSPSSHVVRMLNLRRGLLACKGLDSGLKRDTRATAEAAPDSLCGAPRASTEWGAGLYRMQLYPIPYAL